MKASNNVGGMQSIIVEPLSEFNLSRFTSESSLKSPIMSSPNQNHLRVATNVNDGGSRGLEAVELLRKKPQRPKSAMEEKAKLIRRMPDN